ILFYREGMFVGRERGIQSILKNPVNPILIRNVSVVWWIACEVPAQRTFTYPIEKAFPGKIPVSRAVIVSVWILHQVSSSSPSSAGLRSWKRLAPMIFFPAFDLLSQSQNTPFHQETGLYW